jgi:hypothetical protein
VREGLANVRRGVVRAIALGDGDVGGFVHVSSIGDRPAKLDSKSPLYFWSAMPDTNYMTNTIKLTGTGTYYHDSAVRVGAKFDEATVVTATTITFPDGEAALAAIIAAQESFVGYRKGDPYQPTSTLRRKLAKALGK